MGMAGLELDKWVEKRITKILDWGEIHCDPSDDYYTMPESISDWIDIPSCSGMGHEIRPRVRELLIEMFEDYDRYDEYVIDGGIGIGKSFLSGIGTAYGAHRLCCLKDPRRHFNLGGGDLVPIAIMNMSVGAKQAEKIVFNQMADKLVRSPWFLSRGLVPHKSVKGGELSIGDKGVQLIAGNSRETTFVGFDLFMGVLDEAAWHMVTKEKDYAEEGYNVMKQRINSRFPGQGKIFIISSPRYVNDFIERKLEEAKTNPRIYARRVQTWESTTGYLKGGGKFFRVDYSVRKIIEDNSPPSRTEWTVPEFYLPDFKRDCDRACRDLGAYPSYSIQSFFNEVEKIQEHSNKNRTSPFTETGQFSEEFQTKAKTDRRPRFIHIDLGLNKDMIGDACGIAMGCLDGYNYTKEGDRKPKVLLDLMLRIVAKDRKEIKFGEVRKFIYQLRDLGFIIEKITYDGWQSLDSRQILEEKGFNVGYLSVDRTSEAYETMRELLLDKRLDYYDYPPFLEECLCLEFLKGRKVDHSPQGSKDVADAVAGVCQLCVTELESTGDAGVFTI